MSGFSIYEKSSKTRRGGICLRIAVPWDQLKVLSTPDQKCAGGVTFPAWDKRKQITVLYIVNLARKVLDLMTSIRELVHDILKTMEALD